MEAILHAQNPDLNIRVKLDPWMTPVIHDALARDCYERTERNMVEAAVRPHDVVLELGAGLGVISALCAKVAKRVIAYEANPRLIPIIQETYRLNEVDCHLHQAMLGYQTGFQELYLHADFWESSTVPNPSLERVRVPVINAASVLCTVNPTFLICDIEGGEADLFKTLSYPEDVRKIVVETHPHVIGEKATDRLMADFYAAGFQLVITSGDVWFLARS